jgi:hypothetical protein
MTTEVTRVRSEMVEQGSSLATQMRVLHEDLISRFALLQDGRTRAARRRPRKK